MAARVRTILRPPSGSPTGRRAIGSPAGASRSCSSCPAAGERRSRSAAPRRTRGSIGWARRSAGRRTTRASPSSPAAALKVVPAQRGLRLERAKSPPASCGRVPPRQPRRSDRRGGDDAVAGDGRGACDGNLEPALLVRHRVRGHRRPDSQPAARRLAPRRRPRVPGRDLLAQRPHRQRTEERGFRSAPIIIDGEYEEGIGGGVSQVATTHLQRRLGGWPADRGARPARALHRALPARPRRDRQLPRPGHEVRQRHGQVAAGQGGRRLDRHLFVDLYGTPTGRRVESLAGRAARFAEGCRSNACATRR